MSDLEGKDPEPADREVSAQLRGATTLLGDRWSLLIVGILLRGPHRFSALLKATRGISANVLTKRLRRLEDEGLIEHRVVSSAIDVPVYVLSSWGAELQGPVDTLERWFSSRP